MSFFGSRLNRLRCKGFTYLAVLILVALIALVATASVQVGVLVQRRAAEEELLAIGGEFRNALTSYANATPPGKSPAPQSLQDLLKDSRYPNPRRHLRKLYADPMTGREEWGTTPSQDGTGIGAVHSLSHATPIKIGNFPLAFQDFDGKTSYQDWKFTGAFSQNIQNGKLVPTAVPLKP